jgi:hypothetical protein
MRHRPQQPSPKGAISPTSTSARAVTVQVSQTNETAHILYTIISPSQQASFTVRQLIAKSHLTPSTCHHSKLYRPDHNGGTSSKQSPPAPHSPALSAGAYTTSHVPTGHYRALQRPDRADSSTHPIYSHPSLKEQYERYIQRPILHQKLFSLFSQLAFTNQRQHAPHTQFIPFSQRMLTSHRTPALPPSMYNHESSSKPGHRAEPRE